LAEEILLNKKRDAAAQKEGSLSKATTKIYYQKVDEDPHDAELYDAEEAAAVDAHDVSDPGMEAAAMERAVFLAEEIISNQKEKAAAVQKEAQEKVSKEHIDIMEKAAENLAQLIESAKRKQADDLFSLIEEADQEELALLLLERAVMNSANKVQQKAEERVAAATGAVEAAVEAKKFAIAFAQRASQYAKHTKKNQLFSGDSGGVENASDFKDDAEYQLKLTDEAEKKARMQEAEAKEFLEEIIIKEAKLKTDVEDLYDFARKGILQETNHS